MNTTLGEPWGDRGECPEWEHLFECRSTLPLHRNGETPSYSFLNRLEGIQASRSKTTKGTVSAGACMLTASVDVEKDRLECKIVG